MFDIFLTGLPHTHYSFSGRKFFIPLSPKKCHSFERKKKEPTGDNFDLKSSHGLYKQAEKGQLKKMRLILLDKLASPDGCGAGGWGSRGRGEDEYCTPHNKGLSLFPLPLGRMASKQRDFPSSLSPMTTCLSSLRLAIDPSLLPPPSFSMGIFLF